MPKFNEEEWDKIQSNITVISYLQGLPIGNKLYNGVSVIPNNTNEEVVQPESIYIVSQQMNTTYTEDLNNENKYYYITSETLAKEVDTTNPDNGGVRISSPIGIFNTDLERREIEYNNQKYYYYPKLYFNDYEKTRTTENLDDGSTYAGSIFAYVDKKLNDPVKGTTRTKNIAKAYYTALGRERWSSYKQERIFTDLFDEMTIARSPGAPLPTTATNNVLDFNKDNVINEDDITKLNELINKGLEDDLKEELEKNGYDISDTDALKDSISKKIESLVNKSVEPEKEPVMPTPVTEPIYRKADINNDGKIDEKDLDEMNEILDGRKTPNDQEKYAANIVDTDDVIDNKDKEALEKLIKDINSQDDNVYQKGDVNGDGKVDTTDSKLVLDYIDSTEELSNKEKKRADVDENDVIDREDVREIYRIIIDENYKYGDITLDDKLDNEDIKELEDYLKKEKEEFSLPIIAADINKDNKTDEKDLEILKRLLNYDDVKIGDVNRDGKLDEEDSKNIAQIIIGKKDPTEDDKKILDLDGDGKITSNDYKEIQYILEDTNVNAGDVNNDGNVNNNDLNEAIDRITGKKQVTDDEKKRYDLDGNGEYEPEEHKILVEIITGVNQDICTIKYNGNGANSGYVSSHKVEYNKNASIAQNTFTRTGYIFNGWTTKSDGTDDGYGWTNWSGIWKFVEGQRGVTNCELQLYARWKANPLSFDNQTIDKEYSNEEQEFEIEEATNGTGEYKYTEISEKNGNTNTNYITIAEDGSATIAASTPGGVYSYVIRVTDQKSGAYKDATYTITIKKIEGTGSVTISDWTYGDTPSTPVPVSRTNGTANVRYYYKLSYKGDEEYTETIPTDAGNYTLKAVFSETSIYNEVISTTDFTIQRRILVVPEQTGILTYNGEEQTPNWNENYNEKYMNISGNTGIDYGNYTATFSLKDTENLKWNDNTTTDKTANWSIKEAVGVATVSMANWIYGNTPPNPVVISFTNGTENVTIQYKLSDAEDDTYTTTKPTNAGSYVIRAIFPQNGNFDEVQAVSSFSIIKRSLQVPSQIGTLEYNGKEQSPTWNDNYNTTYMNVSGNKGTNAGNYIATFSLKDTANTEWNDNTITDKTVAWNIGTLNGSGSVTMSDSVFGEILPSPTPTSTTNGTTNVTYYYKISTAGNNTYTTTKPTNAGTYTLKAVFAPTENYNEVTAITNFTINKRILNVPTQIGTLEYNGREQSPTWNENYDSSYMNVTGNKGTNVGNYTATFSLKDTSNTQWNDGTTENKTASWSILESSGNASVTMEDWTYGETPRNPVPTSSTNGTANVTYHYKLSTAADNTYTTTKPTNAGTYTVRATFAATANYNQATATANFTINKKKLIVPEQVGTLTYTGREQSPTWDDNYNTTYMNVSGNKATNPGTYTAQFDLKDTANTCWNDNTTNNKSSNWIINAIIYKITLDSNGATSAGRAEVYEKYDIGYYLDSEGTDEITPSSEYSIGVPRRTGYYFAGYYTAIDGGIEYIDRYGLLTEQASPTYFNKDGILYAHWEKGIPDLNITINPTQFIYNGNSQIPVITVKDGNTTLTNNKDYSLIFYNNINVGNATVTITGKNAYNSTTKAFYIASYTGTFYINNAQLNFVYNDREYHVWTKKGDTAVYSSNRDTTVTTIPTVDVPSGYKLDGWYTAASGGSKVLNADGSFTGTAVSGYTTKNSWDVTEDKTLYAHISRNTYTVIYNGNGATGGSTASSSHTYDEPKQLTANGFIKAYSVILDENYSNALVSYLRPASTFNGWSTTGAGEKEYDDKEVVVNLTTNETFNLYANWTLGSTTYIPTREGYSFEGWYTSPECTGIRVDVNGTIIPTSDITIYAKWTPTIYAKYYSDGTLFLSYRDDTSYTASGVTLTKNYGEIRNTQYQWYYKNGYSRSTPWNKDIQKVVINDKIIPLYTSSWFSECSNLTQIQGIEKIDTSNVITMDSMFHGCSSLQSLDLRTFETLNVTDMRFMFSGCTALEDLNLSSFDTSNVTDMSSMFLWCYELEVLDLSSFNTSNVTKMDAMFYECNALESLDLSNFNTSNVTKMDRMFYMCNRLSNLNLSSFDTSNVTDMSFMFFRCYELEVLDLSSFNTANVTDMSRIFLYDGKLATIYVTDKFKTSQLTNSTDSGMFLDNTMLVGGNGTTYSSAHQDKEYARIDKPGQPGYFTSK